MKGILESFIALFVIMDPIGTLPIFISLIKGMPAKEVKKNIERAVIVAGLLLFIFLFLGPQIFKFFGINLNSFQIAGGVILFIMGVFYALGAPLNFIRSHSNDLSVPVGTPLLTGPGVIMTTIILVGQYGTFVTVISALLALLATWLILINYSAMYKFLGQHWSNVISRVTGIILAAVAVEFITKGILNIIITFKY